MIQDHQLGSNTDYVRDKIAEHRKKDIRDARARAYRPSWNSKQVRMRKVIKCLMDAFENQDFEAVLRVWRDALSATTKMWDIKNKCYVVHPDHKTRIAAANMIAAYAEGLPVQRQIQLNLEHEELKDVLARARQSPAMMAALQAMGAGHLLDVQKTGSEKAINVPSGDSSPTGVQETNDS